MSSRLANQSRVLVELLDRLAPHLATDRSLPDRVRSALSDRRFGSRDRRVYRELTYTALRHWAWWEELRNRSTEEAVTALVWLAGPSATLAPWRENLLTDWPALPIDLSAQKDHLNVTTSCFPSWWPDAAPAAQTAAENAALLRRAPVWLRIQAEEAQVLSFFADRGWPVTRSPHSPNALALPADVDITREPPYLAGWVEVQDIGSQRLLTSAPPSPGERWFDACAGAGGKSLALAAAVGPHGRVIAYEPRTSALKELAERARRSPFRSIEIRTQPPDAAERFDGVLVDAPCSGSGTWRRSPHLKACTRKEDVVAASLKQRELLARYSRSVRPGGRLIYATCSLCSAENEEVVTSFLDDHADFRVQTASASGQPGHYFLPSTHEGDGFYAAYLIRA